MGYGVCSFRPLDENPDRHFLYRYRTELEEQLNGRRVREDPYVRLARETVESWVTDRKTPEVPAWAPEDMTRKRAGVFVSIHKEGRLRGCIGTFLPTRDCIAREIISNAVSAATRDPRFDPITPEELKWLEINVDVLSAPERISNLDQLDVRRYGVIVSSGSRRGLLLPDLDGVDTVEEQVAIARQKGGIRENEPVTLDRFEVVRHL